MINLRANNTCLSCANNGALLHLMTFCAEAKDIWRWTGAGQVLTHTTDPGIYPVSG